MVYYYYNKWSKLGVFEQDLASIQKAKAAQLHLDNLNLDGTHSLAKKGAKRFFDEKQYKNRFVVERTFAWMDSFRTLLIRHDTYLHLQLEILAFSRRFFILCKSLNQFNKKISI